MQKISVIFLLSILIGSACTKGPGTGGRSTIKGRVFARNYSNAFNLIDTGYIGNYKVFIQYGNLQGVGDDVDTDYEGVYLFPYLRPGDYTLFTYSKRLVNNALDTVLVQKVTISKRKETVELPRFEINTLKN